MNKYLLLVTSTANDDIVFLISDYNEVKKNYEYLTKYPNSLNYEIKSISILEFKNTNTINQQTKQ